MDTTSGSTSSNSPLVPDNEKYRADLNSSLLAKDGIPAHKNDSFTDIDIDDSLKVLKLDGMKKSSVSQNKKPNEVSVTDNIVKLAPVQASPVQANSTSVISSRDSSSLLRAQQATGDTKYATRSLDNLTSQLERQGTSVVKVDLENNEVDHGTAEESGSGEINKGSGNKVDKLLDVDKQSSDISGSGDGDADHSKRNLILEDVNIGMVSKTLSLERSGDPDYLQKHTVDKSNQVGGSAEGSGSGDVNTEEAESKSDQRNHVTDVPNKKTFRKKDSLFVTNIPHSNAQVTSLSNPDLSEENNSEVLSGSANEAEDNSNLKLKDKVQAGESSGSGDPYVDPNSFISNSNNNNNNKNKGDQISEVMERDQIAEIKNRYTNTKGRRRTFDTYNSPEKEIDHVSYYTASELKVANFGQSEKADAQHFTSKRSNIIADVESSGSGNDKLNNDMHVDGDASASGDEKANKKNDVTSSIDVSGSGDNASGLGLYKHNKIESANKRHLVSDSDTSGSADVESAQTSSDDEKTNTIENSSKNSRDTIYRKSKLPKRDDIGDPSGSGDFDVPHSGDVSGFSDSDVNNSGSGDFEMSNSGSGSGDTVADNYGDIGVDYKAYNRGKTDHRRQIAERNILKNKGYSSFVSYTSPRRERVSYYKENQPDDLLNAPDTREIGSVKAAENYLNNVKTDKADSLSIVGSEDTTASGNNESNDELDQTFLKNDTVFADSVNKPVIKNGTSKVHTEQFVLKNEKNQSTHERSGSTIGDTITNIGYTNKSRNITHDKDGFRNDTVHLYINKDGKVHNKTTHKQYKENNKGKTLANINHFKKVTAKAKVNNNHTTNVKTKKVIDNVANDTEATVATKMNQDTEDSDDNSVDNNNGKQHNFLDDNNESSIANIEDELNDSDDENKKKTTGNSTTIRNDVSDEAKKKVTDYEKGEIKDITGNEGIEYKEGGVRIAVDTLFDHNGVTNKSHDIYFDKNGLENDTLQISVDKNGKVSYKGAKNEHKSAHRNKFEIRNLKNNTTGLKNNSAVNFKSPADHDKKRTSDDTRKGHFHRKNVSRDENNTLTEVEFYHNKSGLYETENSYNDINLLRNETLLASRDQNDASNLTLYGYLHKNNWSGENISGKTGPLGDSVYSYLDLSEVTNLTSDALLQSHRLNNDTNVLPFGKHGSKTKTSQPYVEQDTLNYGTNNSSDYKNDLENTTINSYGEHSSSQVDGGNVYLGPSDISNENNTVNLEENDVTNETIIPYLGQHITPGDNSAVYLDKSNPVNYTNNVSGDLSEPVNNTGNVYIEQGSPVNDTSNVYSEQNGSANYTNNAYVEPSVSATDTSNVNPNVAATDTSNVNPNVAATVTSNVDPNVAATGTGNVEPSIAATDTSNVDLSVYANDTSNVDQSVLANSSLNTNVDQNELLNGTNSTYFDKDGSSNGNLDNSDSTNETNSDYIDADQNAAGTLTSDTNNIYLDKSDSKTDHNSVSAGESDSENKSNKNDLDKDESINITDFSYLHKNPTPNITDFLSLHQIPKTTESDLAALAQSSLANDTGNASSSEIDSLPDIDNTFLGKNDSENNNNNNISVTQVDLTNNLDILNLTTNYAENGNEYNNLTQIDSANDNANLTNTDSTNDTLNANLDQIDSTNDTDNTYSHERDFSNDTINGNFDNIDSLNGNHHQTGQIPISLNESDQAIITRNNSKKGKVRGTGKINLDVKVFSSGVTNIFVDHKGNIDVRRVDGKNSTDKKNKTNLIRKNTGSAKADVDEDIMEDDPENEFLDSKSYTYSKGNISSLDMENSDMRSEKEKERINLNQTSFENAKISNLPIELENDSGNIFVDSKSITSNKHNNHFSRDGLRSINHTVSKNNTRNIGFNRMNLKTNSINNGINLISLKVKSTNITTDKIKGNKNNSNVAFNGINAKNNNSNIAARRIALKNGGIVTPHNLNAKTNISNSGNNKHSNKNNSHATDVKSIEVDNDYEIVNKKINLDEIKAKNNKDPSSTDENNNEKNGSGNSEYERASVGNETANEVSRSALKIVEDLVDIINTTHSKHKKNDSEQDSDIEENKQNFVKTVHATKRKNFSTGGYNYAPWKHENDIPTKNSEANSSSKIKDKRKLHILEITSMIVSGMKKQRVANKKKIAHKIKVTSASKRHLPKHRKKEEHKSLSSSVSLVKRDAYEQPTLEENVLEKHNNIPQYEEQQRDIDVDKKSLVKTNLIPPEYVEVETEQLLPQTTQKQLLEPIKRSKISTPYAEQVPEEITLVKTSEIPPEYTVEPTEQIIPEAIHSQHIESLRKNQIPLEYISDQDNVQQSLTRPMLAQLEKRNDVSSQNLVDKSKLKDFDTTSEQAQSTSVEKNNDMQPQYIDKRDKIWTDDQDDNSNEESNVIDGKEDSTTKDISQNEESTVKTKRPHKRELQIIPSTELRSNILNMLSSRKTTMSTSSNDANKIPDADKPGSTYGSGNTEGSDTESGSGENWYGTSGYEAGSAEPTEESSPSINTKRKLKRSLQCIYQIYI